jgi:RimJ/RimL family protein N-acetyltransferase
MLLQIQALFVHDSEGRLRYIREPGYDEAEPETAPRFFMGRTQTGNVWRFRHDLPEELVRSLELLCSAEPVAIDLAVPPQNAAAIREVLDAHRPIQKEERGPAFWIPAGIPAPPHVQIISAANAHLLEAHFPWALASQTWDQNGPLAAAVVAGSAVSLCFCSRITDRAAEAGVETTPAFRGQGSGSAAVAGWAAAVRERGLLPLYSTTWENAASQGIARRLGMVCYGEDWSIE